MNRPTFWILISLSLAWIIISLTLGHIYIFYNPNIKSAFSGVISSLLALIIILLFHSQNKSNYLNKCKIPILCSFAISGALSLSFQFALGFYLGGSGCFLWLMAAIAAGVTN